MTAPRPYALLAELTYRCPLHCPYCSNPTRARSDGDLTTDEWRRVLREATELGVLQVGFSGGNRSLGAIWPNSFAARAKQNSTQISSRAVSVWTNLGPANCARPG